MPMIYRVALDHRRGKLEMQQVEAKEEGDSFVITSQSWGKELTETVLKSSVSTSPQEAVEKYLDARRKEIRECEVKMGNARALLDEEMLRSATKTGGNKSGD
jgi:hypothetical protein